MYNQSEFKYVGMSHIERRGDKRKKLVWWQEMKWAVSPFLFLLLLFNVLCELNIDAYLL